jgi:hypothetical protein
MFLTFCMMSHRHAQGWFDISLLSGCAGSSVCMLLCRVAPVLPRIAKQDARSVLGWSAVEVAAASHHTLLCWHAQVLAGVLPRLVDIGLSYPPHAPPYSSYLACTIPIVTWHLTSTGCLLDVPCVQLGLHLSVGGMGRHGLCICTYYKAVWQAATAQLVARTIMLFACPWCGLHGSSLHAGKSGLLAVYQFCASRLLVCHVMSLGR